MGMPINLISALDGEDPYLFGFGGKCVDNPILAEPDFPKQVHGAFEGLPNQMRGSREAVLCRLDNCPHIRRADFR